MRYFGGAFLTAVFGATIIIRAWESVRGMVGGVSDTVSEVVEGVVYVGTSSAVIYHDVNRRVSGVGRRLRGLSEATEKRLDKLTDGEHKKG
ncbi:MAG: hypothetical protein NUW01_09980 [Gemmatimonadaceae bacterium]|nr:hypothetical protein [Gemmatimonadaceae bacterium]